MKLTTITLMPKNCENAVEFFKKVCGLSIVNEIKNDYVDIKFLGHDKESTLIEIVDTGKNEEKDLADLSLIFEADKDLEDIKKIAQDLGFRASDIKDMPPKPKFIEVTGPCGIKIEFM